MLRKYFQFLWLEQKGLHFEKCPVYKGLPPHVTQDLLSFCVPLLASWPFLKDICRSKLQSSTNAAPSQPGDNSSVGSGAKKYFSAVNALKRPNSSGSSSSVSNRKPYVSAAGSSFAPSCTHFNYNRCRHRARFEFSWRSFGFS
jgi:hypothetical protein